jgi:group I intron endonuclease
MDYIYKITNTVNNKSYVGYTTDPQARWEAHRHNQGSRLVFQAIKKYGVDKFTFEVIAKDTVENEQQYINDHNTMAPNGYNLTEGGSLPPNHKGKTYKEIYGADWKQQIAKRQQANKGKHDMPHTKATREKISKNNARAMLGKKHSKKTLKLISESKKGLHKGAGNPNAKRFLLIAPDGEQYQALGNLKAMCNTLNLNHATVRKSYELNRPMRSGWRVIRGK